MRNNLAIRELTPTSTQQEQSVKLVGLACDEPLTKFLVKINGKNIPIRPELSELIGHIITNAAAGVIFQIRMTPKELSTTTAAEMIGVSRPTLMKLVNEGKLNHHMVGSHVRLKRDDVVSYLEDKEIVRQKAYSEFRELEANLSD